MRVLIFLVFMVESHLGTMGSSSNRKQKADDASFKLSEAGKFLTRKAGSENQPLGNCPALADRT